MFVGLRFPNQPTCLEDVIERRFICLAAQRQADAGIDVTAPDGVEIVFLAQPHGTFDGSMTEATYSSPMPGIGMWLGKPAHSAADAQ